MMNRGAAACIAVILACWTGCSDEEGGNVTDPGGLVLQMLGSPVVEKPSHVTLKFTVATAEGCIPINADKESSTGKNR